MYLDGYTSGWTCIFIKAQEQPKHLPTNSSTETVTITVRDINDNVPTFNSTHYNGSILENTPAGIPVDLQTDMNVYDIDQVRFISELIIIMLSCLIYAQFK